MISFQLAARRARHQARQKRADFGVFLTRRRPPDTRRVGDLALVVNPDFHAVAQVRKGRQHALRLELPECERAARGLVQLAARCWLEPVEHLPLDG
jgi:hypothetical protein